MLSASLITREKIKSSYQSIVVAYNNANKTYLSSVNDDMYNRMMACVYTVNKQNQSISGYSYAGRDEVLFSANGDFEAEVDNNNGNHCDVIYTVKYLGTVSTYPKYMTVERKNATFTRQSGVATGYYNNADALTAISAALAESVTASDWQILTANFTIKN